VRFIRGEVMGNVNYIRTPGGASELAAYPQTIRTLSDRLVELQRPIKILDAIRWDPLVEHAFFAAGARELPPVTRDYYAQRPLPFDLDNQRRQLQDLEADLRQLLPADDPAARIMRRICQEHQHVLELLRHRGTPTFPLISARLYGSSSDSVPAGGPSLAELGRMLSGLLSELDRATHAEPEEPRLTSRQAVQNLAERLGVFFRDSAAVRVQVSAGILANATAGSDYIKLRDDASFTQRELRLLEVHEGWVHLGTTINGQRQPICTFLAKGSPSATITQEGLAVLTEFFALASHPARVRRLMQRVQAVALAEEGASFLDVYRFFLDEGCEPHESYQQAVRVFRGSLPAGCGPFTKDLCYSKGFVLVHNFLRLAVTGGQVRRIPLLFCGKTDLGDLADLAQLVEAGLVVPPRHLPPPFADLQALSAWMCYGHFLGGMLTGEAIARPPLR